MQILREGNVLLFSNTERKKIERDNSAKKKKNVEKEGMIR